MCDEDHMNLYYNKKVDTQSCGVNSKGLQGCLGGFFQPVENPSYEAAKACPSGYWCPVNLICTIPCPYGELSMAMAMAMTIAMAMVPGL